MIENRELETVERLSGRGVCRRKGSLISMKRMMWIFAGFTLAVAAACFQPVRAETAINIVPAPEKADVTEGTFFSIRPDTAIWTCAENDEAAEYFAALLRPATGYPVPVSVKAPDAQENIPAGTIVVCPKLAELCAGDGPEAGFCRNAAALGGEGYILGVSKDNVLIFANMPAGLFYGVQSFRQLLPPEIESRTRVDGVEWKVPAVKIIDKPRFVWRGLMLDVSRHFQPKEFVLKYIDTMAAFKLNHLHLHLTDDQGWRIEIKKFPSLTKIGAWRGKSDISDEMSFAPAGEPHGGFYTQDDIRDIVAYAQKRFITIVPEIEMPGHAQAALASLPGLSCTDKRLKVRTRWGVNKEVYCAGSDKVFDFLEAVIDEVAELFPGEYIHIGGDEVPKDRWKECPRCQARLKAEGLKDEHELQSWFITKMEKYINSKGKKIIGWDEILEGGLAPNAAVMSWRGVDGGIAAASQGHEVVMSPTSHCYLDYNQAKEGEPRAIGGFIPLCKVYSFEPVPAALAPDRAKFILGAQGNLWTEYIETPEYAEYMTYPRAAAIAEVGWTRADLKNWPDFQHRMTPVYGRLKLMGVNFRAPKPEDAGLCE